jgi:hypothetical protein
MSFYRHIAIIADNPPLPQGGEASAMIAGA